MANNVSQLNQLYDKLVRATGKLRLAKMLLTEFSELFLADSCEWGCSMSDCVACGAPSQMDRETSAYFINHKPDCLQTRVKEFLNGV